MDIFDDMMGGDSGGAAAGSPFHGDNSVVVPQAPQPGGGGGDLGGGLLDFIDNAGSADAAPKAELYRIRKRSGRVIGPFDEVTVIQMFEKQELSGGEEGSVDGVNWKPLAQIPAFSETIQKAMAAALSGLGMEADLPGLPNADLPGIPGADLPGLPNADLPGVAGADLPGVPGGPSTGELLDAERARERAAAMQRARAAGGGRGAMFAAVGAVLALVVVLGVLAGLLTEHGWFGYKFVAKLINGEKVETKKGPEEPPPPPLPTSDVSLAELLSRDTYVAYRQAAEQQALVVKEGKTRTPIPPEVGAAAVEQAHFLAYLVVVENMPIFDEKRKEALATAKAQGGKSGLGMAIAEAAGDLVEKKSDKAVARLKKFTANAKGPEGAEALWWHGTALRRKGDNKNAMKAFDSALVQNPQHKLSLLSQADLLFAAGELDSASWYVDKVLELAADHPRANLLKGRIDVLSPKKKVAARGKALLSDIATQNAAPDSAPTQQARAFMGLSEAAVAAREWDNALKQMNAAVEKRPKDDEIRLQHGQLALKLREFNVAQETYKKILERDADNEAAVMGLAAAKIGARDALDAYREVNKRLEQPKYKKHAMFNYWLGNAAVGLGKRDEAVKQWKKARDLDPGLAAPHVKVINAYLEKGKLREATNAAQKAFDSVKPQEKHMVRVAKAGIFLSNRQYSSAKLELEKALEQAPRNVDALMLYIDFLIHDEKLKVAEKKAGFARSLDPKNPKVLAGEAEVLLAQGKLDKAVALMQEAVALDNLDHEMLLRAAAIAVRAEQYGEAKGYLKTVSEMVPLHPELANLQGQVERVSQPKMAERYFKEAIAMQPDNPRYLFQAGLNYRAMNENIEAKAHFERAYRADPNFHQAHYYHGLVLKDLGQLAKAEKQFQEVVRIDPRRADAFMEIANLRAAQGDSKGSIKAYDRAIKNNPKNPTPLCEKGIVLVQQLGDSRVNRNAGIKVLNKCVKLNPKHESAWRILGNAYADKGKRRDAVKAFTAHIKANPGDSENDYLCERLKDWGKRCPGDDEPVDDDDEEEE